MAKITRISFDLDGVLVNFAPTFSRLLAEVHPDADIVEHRDCVEFYIEAHFGLDREIGRQAFGAMTPAHWANMAPLPSPEDMNYLRDVQTYSQVQIYACTARHIKIEKITREWLDRYALHNVILLMDKGRGGKGAQLDQLDIRHHIDDSKKHAEDVSDHGVNSYILDYPYNQDTSNDIVRVANIAEYLDSILLT